MAKKKNHTNQVGADGSLCDRNADASRLAIDPRAAARRFAASLVSHPILPMMRYPFLFPTPQNQNKKAHKNGIHKPKFHRFVSLKQVRTQTE